MTADGDQKLKLNIVKYDCESLSEGVSEKETNILKYLYRYRDRIVSKEVLLNEVWSHTTSLTTHTLETYIYRLRKKVRVSFASDELIVTKKGGYQLLLKKAF